MCLGGFIVVQPYVLRLGQRGLIDGMAFLLTSQEGSGYAATFTEINEGNTSTSSQESPPSLKSILITFTDGICLSLSLSSPIAVLCFAAVVGICRCIELGA